MDTEDTFTITQAGLDAVAEYERHARAKTRAELARLDMAEAGEIARDFIEQVTGVRL